MNEVRKLNPDDKIVAIRIGSHARWAIEKTRALVAACKSSDTLKEHTGAAEWETAYALALGEAQTMLAELADILEGKRN